MFRSIKYILITILISCLLWASENDHIPDVVKPHPIDLSVYDGQGSLLISWSIPDSIKVSEANVFAREFGQEQFELISLIPRGQFQYLDYNCDPGSRYFYKLEITDIYGKTYNSDTKTPPFGTCIPITFDALFDDDIKSIHHLIIEHLDQELKTIYPYTDLRPVLDLLSPILNSDHKWIEVFPLEQLNEIESAISVLDEVLNDKDLYDDILTYGSLYRNHLYIEPDDWSINVKESILKIRNDWQTLYDQYVDAQDLYALLAPVRIIGCLPADDGYILKIYLFHPDQTYGNDIFVMSGQEFIYIGNHENTDSKLMSIYVPDTWNYADLMMDDVFIQNCPLFIGDSVIYTIEGDIIPMDASSENLIRVNNKESSLWFNEVTWNPFSRRLGVELMAKQDLGEDYFIDNEEFKLWDISTYLGLGPQYMDSLFTLDQESALPTVITLKTWDQDRPRILEYIVLDTLPFAISRMPDGGSWHYSDLQTLGLSNESIDNDFNQGFVPELFVLYQNYPNPFNGQTKISFDLLEDAIVNLYITDATGRIHDKLVDEEYKNSGIYNYVWDGDGRSTGIYFITLVAQVNEAPPAVLSRKMIYLK